MIAGVWDKEYCGKRYEGAVKWLKKAEKYDSGDMDVKLALEREELHANLTVTFYGGRHSVLILGNLCSISLASSFA